MTLINEISCCEECPEFEQNYQYEYGQRFAMDDLCNLANDRYMDRNGPNEIWYNCPLKEADS